MTGSYISDSPRTHRPDLVVGTVSARIPVEVELSRKSRQRLKELMAAWARQASYNTVVYLCGSAPLRELIAEQARRSGADQVVRVAALRPRASAVATEVLRTCDEASRSVRQRE